MAKRSAQVTIPEKIRILGKSYGVQIVQGLENCGECVDSKQTIRVQAGMPHGLERDTVLHEIIHALDYGMHLSMTERQVSALAAGLVAVLVDNPSLLTYYQHPERLNEKQTGKR
jgi:hypothetical protein